jgi:hypothetical protein
VSAQQHQAGTVSRSLCRQPQAMLAQKPSSDERSSDYAPIGRDDEEQHRVERLRVPTRELAVFGFEWADAPFF